MPIEYSIILNSLYLLQIKRMSHGNSSVFFFSQSVSQSVTLLASLMFSWLFCLCVRTRSRLWSISLIYCQCPMKCISKYIYIDSTFFCSNAAPRVDRSDVHIHSFHDCTKNKILTQNLLFFDGFGRWYFSTAYNLKNTPWNFSLIGFICCAFLHTLDFHPTDSTTPNNATHRLPQSLVNIIRSGRTFVRSLVRSFAYPLISSDTVLQFVHLSLIPISS